MQFYIKLKSNSNVVKSEVENFITIKPFQPLQSELRSKNRTAPYELSPRSAILISIWFGKHFRIPFHTEGPWISPWFPLSPSPCVILDVDAALMSVFGGILSESGGLDQFFFDLGVKSWVKCQSIYKVDEMRYKKSDLVGVPWLTHMFLGHHGHEIALEHSIVLVNYISINTTSPILPDI